MAATRRCPRCPRLIPAGTRYCPTHAREYEAKRGTSTQRGYGPTHQALRARWAPQVATGTVRCWRCGELIRADEPWDLGHDDNDRSITRGPEHAARCNRSAAGRHGRAAQG